MFILTVPVWSDLSLLPQWICDVSTFPAAGSAGHAPAVGHMGLRPNLNTMGSSPRRFVEEKSRHLAGQVSPGAMPSGSTLSGCGCTYDIRLTISLGATLSPVLILGVQMFTSKSHSFLVGRFAVHCVPTVGRPVAHVYYVSKQTHCYVTTVQGYCQPFCLRSSQG